MDARGSDMEDAGGDAGVSKMELPRSPSADDADANNGSTGGETHCEDKNEDAKEHAGVSAGDTEDAHDTSRRSTRAGDVHPQMPIDACSSDMEDAGDDAGVGTIANATEGTGMQAEIRALLSVDSSYEEYWKQHGTKKDYLLTNYLEWKAETRSIVPILFRLNRQLCNVATVILVFLTFSMQPNKKRVAELLFPAVLHVKRPAAQPQIGNKSGGILFKYNLVRMRKPFLALAYAWTLPCCTSDRGGGAVVGFGGVECSTLEAYEHVAPTTRGPATGILRRRTVYKW
eukprot:g115.t1